MPGWKRAAYNRVSKIQLEGIERRAKRNAILNASQKPWSANEDWKAFRKGMKKDGKGSTEPFYKVKKSLINKRRQNRRRAVLYNLKKVDQVAAQHNMLAIKATKLASKDQAANEITPDPAPTKLFRDQRHEIGLIEKTIKKLGVSAYKDGDEDRFRVLHADLADMVPQLKEIVIQQARLTAQQITQSTAELYLALDAEQPKRKDTRRGKRAGERNKRETQPEGASASSQTPGLALVARLCAPDDESSSSGSKDGNEMSYFARGSFCVQCAEHNIHTAARINGYTGFTLCLSCTMKFYDPNMTDAHFKPGRALFPDEDDQEMVNPPIIPDEESSFDEDYVPKPTPDPASLFEAFGIEPKESMAGQKIDLKDPVIKKDTMDGEIAKRAQWATELKAQKARARTLEEVAKRAETYESDESSISTEEEEDTKKKGSTQKMRKRLLSVYQQIRPLMRK